MGLRARRPRPVAGNRRRGRLTVPDGPARRITGYDRDDEGHWVALLDCGHRQHLRHNPPWTNRPWVLTEDGRARHVGERLRCRRCLEVDC